MIPALSGPHVFRLPPGAELVKGKDWRADVGLPEAVASVFLREVCLDRETSEADSVRSYLVAGTPAEIIPAFRNFSKLADIHTRSRILVADVRHLNGFGIDSGAARLLRNAYSAARLALPCDLEGNRYLALLEARMVALPRARDAMHVAEALLHGHRVRPSAVAAMDAALGDRTIRLACLDLGLDTEPLALAVAKGNVAEAAAIRSVWNQTLFGEMRAIDGIEPASLELADVDRLHAAIRWVTGEDPHSGRPLIPHSTGGCAAFAVLLNRVLEGRGRYVGSGEPSIGLCGHVALRLGDYVCDGSGVHQVEAFARSWCRADGPHEILDQSEDGDQVRRLASRIHGLDEEGLEYDLRDALGLQVDAGFSMQ